MSKHDEEAHGYPKADAPDNQAPKTEEAKLDEDQKDPAESQSQGNIIFRGFSLVFALTKWFVLTFYEGFKAGILFTPFQDLIFFKGQHFVDRYLSFIRLPSFRRKK